MAHSECITLQRKFQIHLNLNLKFICSNMTMLPAYWVSPQLSSHLIYACVHWILAWYASTKWFYFLNASRSSGSLDLVVLLRWNNVLPEGIKEQTWNWCRFTEKTNLRRSSRASRWVWSCLFSLVFICVCVWEVLWTQTWAFRYLVLNWVLSRTVNAGACQTHNTWFT